MVHFYKKEMAHFDKRKLAHFDKRKWPILTKEKLPFFRTEKCTKMYDCVCPRCFNDSFKRKDSTKKLKIEEINNVMYRKLAVT